MKPLILPLVAFVICFALGGGAGAYVMKPSAADSTMADSTMADSAMADSTHADSTRAEPGHAADSTSDSTATSVPHKVEPATDRSAGPLEAHAADALRAPSGAAAGTPSGTPSGTPANQLTIQSLLRAQSGATVSLRPDGTIGAERPDSLPDYARMARLLSRMGPREAARTIERLGGTEAARALGAMTDKQAALVLSQLTPEKAAALLLATLALLPKTVAP